MNKIHLGLAGFHISFVGGTLMIYSAMRPGSSYVIEPIVLLIGGFVLTLSSFLLYLRPRDTVKPVRP